MAAGSSFAFPWLSHRVANVHDQDLICLDIPINQIRISAYRKHSRILLARKATDIRIFANQFYRFLKCKLDVACSPRAAIIEVTEECRQISARNAACDGPS